MGSGGNAPKKPKLFPNFDGVKPENKRKIGMMMTYKGMLGIWTSLNDLFGTL